MSSENLPFLFTFRDPAFGLEPPVPTILVLSSPAVYLLLVYVIWPRFRPTTPEAAKTINTWRFRHNVFMCLFSGLCCFATAWQMNKNGEFRLFRDDGTLGREYVFCSTYFADWNYYLYLAFIASKIHEWWDTAFLVWGKRGPTGALSFLHVYHHATTLMLFLLTSSIASPVKFGLILNGGVHFLMYWHYAKPFPKPLVPLITVAQMVQLACCIYCWCTGWYYCGTPEGIAFALKTAKMGVANGDNTNVIGRVGAEQALAGKENLYSYFQREYPFDFNFCYLMVPVYLLFFMHYFVKRFFLGGGAKKKISNSKKD